MITYPDYASIEIHRNEADAKLFASVGLGWLASVCRRTADRIRNTPANTKPSKS